MLYPQYRIDGLNGAIPKKQHRLPDREGGALWYRYERNCQNAREVSTPVYLMRRKPLPLGIGNQRQVAEDAIIPCGLFC